MKYVNGSPRYSVRGLEFSIFLFWVGVISFGVVSTGLLAVFSSSIAGVLCLLFVALGMVMGFFILSSKLEIVNKLFIYNQWTLSFTSAGVLFLIPFTHVSYSYFWLPQIAMDILLVLFGIGAVLYLDSVHYYMGHAAKIQKKAYWPYLGIFVGSMSVALAFFYNIYLVLVPIFCFTALTLSFKRADYKAYILGAFLILSSGGLFYTYIIHHVFNIHFSPSVELERGDSSNVQLALSTSYSKTMSDLGVGKNFNGIMPEAKDIYLNGVRYDSFLQASNPDYVHYTGFSVVHELMKNQKTNTLILNTRGSSQVYYAHVLGSDSINAIEAEPRILEETKNYQSSYLGGIYHNQETIFYHSSSRIYVRSVDRTYNLIVLPFHIFDNQFAAFQHISNKLLTKEAFADYWRILSPQGSIYLDIKTPYKKLSEYLVVNVLATVKLFLGSNQELADHVRLFAGDGDTLHLIISKAKKSLQTQELYEQILANAGFVNQLAPHSYYSGLVDAVNTNDKNVFQALSYRVSGFKDLSVNAIDSESLKYPKLFAQNLNTMLLTMLGIALITVALLVVKIWLVKRNELGAKVALPRFVGFFGLSGFASGVIFVLWKELFAFAFETRVATDGVIIVLFATASLFGAIIFYKVKQYFLRTILSISMSLLLLVIYMFGFQMFIYYAMLMPLVGRVVFGFVVLAPIFIFLLTIPLSSSQWINRIIEQKQYLSYFTYMCGVIVGVIVAFVLLLFTNVMILALLSCVLLIISMVLFLIIDSEYKKSHFLYRKLKY